MSTETIIYDELIGKTFSKVYASEGNTILTFETECGDKYNFFHDQDCCETVEIKEIVGELSDLEGSPILKAEEIVNTNEDEIKEKYPPEHWYDSVTWTFYKFATMKGYVDVSWIGQSNGYYSERVDFEIVKAEDKIEELEGKVETYLNLLRNSHKRNSDLILEKMDTNSQLEGILKFMESKTQNSLDSDYISVKNTVKRLYDKTKVKEAIVSG